MTLLLVRQRELRVPVRVPAVVRPQVRAQVQQLVVQVLVLVQVPPQQARTSPAMAVTETFLTQSQALLFLAQAQQRSLAQA